MPRGPERQNGAVRGLLVASCLAIAVGTAACGSSSAVNARPSGTSSSLAGSSDVATDSGNTRQVGSCSVTVSVSPDLTPSQSNDGEVWSETYSDQCPLGGGTNQIGDSETPLSDMNGALLIQDGGGSGPYGASDYVENQYLTANRSIVRVRLIEQKTGRTLVSVQPVWSASLHVGFSPLIWIGSNQAGLEVQAVTAASKVIASESWDGSLPSSNCQPGPRTVCASEPISAISSPP